MARREQALGEGVGSAHVWLVCLVGWVASIVLARRQPGSDGGEYFSSLLERATVPTGEVRSLPHEPATTRGFWRDPTKKSPNREWLGHRDWWSWRDLNPRPQIFHAQFYMFSGLI